MVDRLEMIAAQQLGELSRTDAIALVPVFQQSVLARIADHQFGHTRVE
jgi:hypothetical protein